MRVLNLDPIFTWSEDSSAIYFDQETDAGTHRIAVDIASGTATSSTSTDSLESLGKRNPLLSPDGSQLISRSAHNLRVSSTLGGESRQISSSGLQHFTYGIDPDHPTRRKVAERLSGKEAPLKGVFWSPNAQYIIALRQDLRNVPERLLTAEYLASDEAGTPAHFIRAPVAGSQQTTQVYISIFDLKGKREYCANLDNEWLDDFSIQYFSENIIWWTEDGLSLFILASIRGGGCYRLVKIDITSGEAKTVIEELDTHRVRLNQNDYSCPNVYVWPDGSQALWYSERDGFGHLYLYDVLNGTVKAQLTSGDNPVFDVLHVDPTSNHIYYTSALPEHGGTPYFRYLFRLALEDGSICLLTPEVADHHFINPFRADAKQTQTGSIFSPNGQYFVDSFSTTATPTKSVLRRTDGSLVATLIESNITALRDSGWRPCEQVVVTAADGCTDLYGALIFPRSFDKTRSYPLIDCIYPGPQGRYSPVSFPDQFTNPALLHLQAIADSGFIVFAVDGRGTSQRSRTFRDAYMGQIDAFGIGDHVAAIREISRGRQYIDPDRIGIVGQSFGGYAALRALMLFPDFFKAGVCSTPPGDWLTMIGPTNVERFFGVPTNDFVREYYEKLSISSLVAEIKGHLMLVYGGVDENVTLDQSFKVIDSLVKADKEFDLVLVPDAGHAVANHPYVLKRTISFLTEKLLEGDHKAVPKSKILKERSRK